jgi:hypothetical protein
MRRANKKFITVSAGLNRAQATRPDVIKYFETGRMPSGLITSVFNPAKDDVVVANYEISLSVSPTVIVEDVIDVIIMRREGTRTNSRDKYRIIQFCDDPRINNNRYVDFRASLCRLALQRLLGSKAQRSYNYEIWPIYGKIKKLEPKTRYKPVIYTVANNVAHAINEELYYSTTSSSVCRNCEYRNHCSLSLVRN